MIPIGDEPNEGGFPLVNYALILANVLVFVVGQQAGKADGVVERYAYVPSDPSVLTAFSSMFLHGSWMHLLGNMLFLWIFGDNVEARLGRLGYLAAYLGTGLFGAVVHGLMSPGSAIPSLGASGAISGVQGLYVVAFPHNRVKLLLFFRFIVRVIHVRAPWIVGIWFLINDVLPTLLAKGDGGGIAHGAHLGGFGTGILLCFALRPFFLSEKDAAGEVRPRRSDPRGRGIPDLPPAGPRTVSAPRTASAPRAVSAPSASDPFLLERRAGSPRQSAGRGADASPEVLGLVRSGRTGEAARLMASTLASGGRVSVPESDHLRLALHAEGMRRFDEAEVLFRAFLAAHPAAAGASLAHLGLGLILAKEVGDPGAARPHLLAAAERATDDRVRAAAIQALSSLG